MFAAICMGVALQSYVEGSLTLLFVDAYVSDIIRP